MRHGLAGFVGIVAIWLAAGAALPAQASQPDGRVLEPLRVIDGDSSPQRRAMLLAYSPDGRHIAWSHSANQIVITARQGGLAATQGNRTRRRTDHAWYSPDSARLFTLQLGVGVMWALDEVDAPDGEIAMSSAFSTPGAWDVTRAAWSPDGARLAIGRSTGAVEILDADSGQAVSALPDEAAPGVTHLAYLPDGRGLVVGRASGSVSVLGLDADGGLDGEARTLAEPRPALLAVAVSADGQVAALYRGLLSVWPDPLGATARRRNNPSIPSYSHRGQGDEAGLAFTPDGQALFAGVSPYLMIFDARTLNPVAMEQRAHVQDAPNAVLRLIFSPDGDELAAWQGGPSGAVTVMYRFHEGVEHLER
jgi:WD40 repeat protein